MGACFSASQGAQKYTNLAPPSSPPQYRDVPAYDDDDAHSDKRANRGATTASSSYYNGAANDSDATRLDNSVSGERWNIVDLGDHPNSAIISVIADTPAGARVIKGCSTWNDILTALAHIKPSDDTGKWYFRTSSSQEVVIFGGQISYELYLGLTGTALFTWKPNA